jgi:hypothetical protein
LRFRSISSACKTGGFQEVEDIRFNDLQVFGTRFIRVASGQEQDQKPAHRAAIEIERPDYPPDRFNELNVQKGYGFGTRPVPKGSGFETAPQRGVPKGVGFGTPRLRANAMDVPPLDRAFRETPPGSRAAGSTWKTVLWGKATRGPEVRAACEWPAWRSPAFPCS